MWESIAGDDYLLIGSEKEYGLPFEKTKKFLSDEKFSTFDVRGLKFNPFLKKWKKTNDLSVNYIISSLKN